MDAISQQKRLVEKLSNLTNNKELSWKPDPNDGEPYAKIDDYYVILGEGRSGSGTTVYRIVIQDENENEIETFDDEELDGSSAGKYYQLMGQLVKTARRQAKGTDEAIDKILKSLGD